MSVGEEGSKGGTTLLSSQEALEPFTKAKEPAIGARLGQFRVEARVGSGGRGVVYQAYDEKLKRQVALKVLLDASSASAVFLLEEARAAAALIHPSIAAIFDVQQQEGVLFIVMELVSGSSLRSELTNGRLPLGAVLRYARDIAAGLARAHRSGVVHRDLKPENVMVTPEGNAKILDFGLARMAPDGPPPSGEAGMTGVAGTPGYMAPEQAMGRKVDARADVFSFGVVVWEMLVGHRPFEPWVPSSLSHATGQPSLSLRSKKTLRELAPDAPAGLAKVVERCLAFEPGARFADAGEVVEALRVESAPPVALGAISRKLGVPLALAAALLAGGVWFFGTRPRPPSTPGGAALGPATAAPGPESRGFTLASQPAPVTTEGLCSFFPTFVDDHTLVYARQLADGAELRRLDLATREDAVLRQEEGGESLRPTAGPPGSIVYMFQKRGQEGGRDLRILPLDGGAYTPLAKGTQAAFAAGAYYFVNIDGRSIRKHPLEGPEEVLYEAEPAALFRGLAVAPSGEFMAICNGSVEDRVAMPLCIGSLGLGEHGPLDCATAGVTTSFHPTFSPRDNGLYFGRSESVVRYDPRTKRSQATHVGLNATSLTVSPDAKTLVLSTCEARYEGFRIEADGHGQLLPVVGQDIGGVSVGPHGELAFPVARGTGSALAVTAPDAAAMRLLTSGDPDVTEAAFSPDGKRIVFHDATPNTGGLFVVEADGTTAAHRLTRDPGDALPTWIDGEHVVFMHPEKGLPFGKANLVLAAGGEPEALSKLPGIVLGGVPARRTLLLAIRSPLGDHIVESTLEGKIHDVVLRGVPKGMRWDVATTASPSGRFVTWYSRGEIWRADLEAGTAARVPFTWPRGLADGIQADDEGRIVATFRHSEGQLYEAKGDFP